LFTTSSADNIKALLLSNENVATGYKGTLIAGSLGDGTCKFVLNAFHFILPANHVGTLGGTCSGDFDGLGTYARYKDITDVAVVNTIVTGIEAALYIADSGNNKIRMVELTSGLYKSVTFDSNVDPNAQLTGLTVYTNKLYACIVGAIVRYTFSTSTYLMASGTSKTLHSGSYSG